MGDPITIIDDTDRIARATRAGNLMLGPWETDRCKHGRVYSFRWVWSVGSTPENGDTELGRSGCRLCSSEE